MNTRIFMRSNPQRLQYLFQQYLQDSITPVELREFWKLFSELDEQDNPVKKELLALWDASDAESQPQNKNWERMLQQIHIQADDWEKKHVPVVLNFPFRRIAAAAIIILLVGAGTYFLFTRNVPKDIVKTNVKAHPLQNDVAAGGNNAVLTLSNGKTIILNNAANGNLAREGNTNILKLADNQLSYKPSESLSRDTMDTKSIQYNTLATPRGGEYQLILPDGTLVWLNSASSIHYPTAFPLKDRNVEITGEAYFEVAHKSNQPFKVSVNGMEVEVLGTHFNINAYNDEPFMRATLLEGSIKLRAGAGVHVLSPGQQMQVQRDGKTKLIRNADVEQAIAWKNGVFSFHNTSIYEIMRQVSRWYDVEVSFQKPMDVYLNGTIQKKVNVSQVFQMIEMTGEAKFKIEGRKITVLK